MAPGSRYLANLCVCTTSTYEYGSIKAFVISTVLCTTARRYKLVAVSIAISPDAFSPRASRSRSGKVVLVLVVLVVVVVVLVLETLYKNVLLSSYYTRTISSNALDGPFK